METRNLFHHLKKNTLSSTARLWSRGCATEMLKKKKTRLCITALTSCTPYDRRSKCLMNITNTVTWWSRNALSKLVKKLEASYNYPGRKYFSLATLSELCTLASNKTVKPVICVQLFFSQTVGTLSNSRCFILHIFTGYPSWCSLREICVSSLWLPPPAYSGKHRASSRPSNRRNLSSISWVYACAFSRQVPGRNTLPKRWQMSQCGGVGALLWTPLRWQTPHPITKGKLIHASEKANFHGLYLWSHSNFVNKKIRPKLTNVRCF